SVRCETESSHHAPRDEPHAASARTLPGDIAPADAPSTQPRSSAAAPSPRPSPPQPAATRRYAERGGEGDNNCVGRTSKSIRSRHRDMARTDLEIRPTAWWPLVLTLAALLCTPLTA